MTASPLFRSEKTASRPPSFTGAALGASSNLIGGGGGPGGGGGGGAGPPAAAWGCGAARAGSTCSVCFSASSIDTPLMVHGMPVGYVFLVYSASSLKTW